jgi:5-formyltetrahydrofolate cyclo-ligase
MLKRRQSLSSEERLAASAIAQRHCMDLPEFRNAGVVALYAPVRSELDTALLLAGALAAGKVVVLPAVTGERLQFRRLDHPGMLVCGAFGICEPPPDAMPVVPAVIDFFVIPGVAFDLQGRRVGYGKGYYDRTLHPLEGDGRFAGFCYDFQLVESIAAMRHDVLMDILVTDRRVIRPRGSS